MNRNIRIVIALALVFGITSLARNKIVWAGGTTSGVNEPGLAQLKVFVWDDANRDGVQDVGENGVPDVMVNLFDSADTLVDVTLTDEGGLSLFNNLSPGDYYVEFAPPEGYTFNLQDQYGNDAVNTSVPFVKTAVKTLVAGENSHIWDAGLYQFDAFHHKPKPGSVKPPPRFIRTCKDGNYSIGGVTGLTVSDLKPGYCLQSFLWNHHFAFGHIPNDAGKILVDITFLQIFHHGRLIQELPATDGSITICYAVPPGKEAQIYFYDFNHHYFDKRAGRPSWDPLPTTVENGVACAPAQSTGAYALIGK